MLAKENRLRKTKDFEKVFKKGKAHKEDFLFIKIAENGLKDSRFGFVVSKKVSKKALDRNRIKRQLRGLIKEKLPNIKKGLDIIILVIPGLKDQDFLQLSETIDKIFKNAKIVN
ncbi:MAG: ribonuclease P protein component [Patescibacteria group bacterium]|nr:ribonuclease P protein component [Patescibacteria group bacterium]